MSFILLLSVLSDQLIECYHTYKLILYQMWSFSPYINTYLIIALNLGAGVAFWGLKHSEMRHYCSQTYQCCNFQHGKWSARFPHHVLFMFIRSGFWVGVAMAALVNTSDSAPPPILLLPRLFFRRDFQVCQNGKRGSRRRLLL